MIDPALRLDTYSTRESRLTYSPWAPAPVGTNPRTRNRDPSTSHTPARIMSAT